MKLIAKLFAATALLVGLNNAFAEGRKEATIDLGKGAFKLTVSVPEDVDGPYDFAKNKGPRVNINKDTDGKGYAYGEVMYNARIESGGVVSYKASAKAVFSAKPTYKGALAESLAKSLIKDSGFEGRATKTDCPPAPIDNAYIVCYKMSGNPMYEGKMEPEKYARVLVAVSFSDDAMGYTFMGSVIEQDVSKFNADPSKAESLAKSLAIDIYRNMRTRLN